MAKYSAIKAAVNAYIKANGRKEITGSILNSVLRATIDSLGRFFQFAGGALPTDDPGTPDQNVCYLAGEPGLYTHFGNIRIENEEVALLFWDGEWVKQSILIGIREVNASVDNQVGTPSVDVSYSGGQLVLTFHNLKGDPGQPGDKGDDGDAAGFGTIGADITGGVGTPGVSVVATGDNTAKNLMFHFTNLKGEAGVTSVVATIDNTSGTPSCLVSLVNGQLTLAFSGLKGLKGDTGVSADYPITIYNGLDSDATDQALAAAQGKFLQGEIVQLSDRMDDMEDGFVLADSYIKQPAELDFRTNRGPNGTTKLIETQNGFTMFYVRVKAGQSVIVHLNLSSGYCVSGTTDVFPDDGVLVSDYMSMRWDAGNQRKITAVTDGYVIARFSTSENNFYFEIENIGFGRDVKDTLDGISEQVAILNKETDPAVKLIDISTREQQIAGYATAVGVFTGMGGSNPWFLYVPVSAGKKYRFTGTYNVSTDAYANMLFYPGIPVNGDIGVVLDTRKGNGTPFDITYVAPSDGYVFIAVRNNISYYDAFFLVDTTSKIATLEQSTDDIKTAIDYSTTQLQVTDISSIKGYVINTGAFTRIGDESSPISLRYFRVYAGKSYRIIGTQPNNAYACITFSESVPVTGDFGIILKPTDVNQPLDFSYTADLDGYLFIYAANFTAYVNVPEQKLMTKSDIFAYCEAKNVPLVGVAYQAKYIVVADRKIYNASVSGSFIIPVLAGERYLVRGCVHAYANYALVGFAESLSNGASAVVLKTAAAEETDFSYEYLFTATQNGYLVVWSNVSTYGDKNYVEILKLEYRLEEIFDRYLPESLKIQTFGDSITDNYWGDMSSWVSYIPDNIKNTELTIVNSAVGGAAIGGNGEYNIPHQVTDGYTRTGGTIAPPLDSTSDMVVIFCGTNDYAGGISLASVKENLASSLQYIFEHSKAKVLLCTPLQRYNTTDQGFDTDADGVPVNSQGYTLRDLCDELIKVCRRFSVPVLDLNAEANINRYNILDYSLDGLHPQRWGDAFVSRLICDKIKHMMWGNLQ